MMGTLPIVKNYNTAQPINPATNQVWTLPDYLRAACAIGAAVRSQLGTSVTANGLAIRRSSTSSTSPCHSALPLLASLPPRALFVTAA